MLSLADDDVDFRPPLLLAAHCYYIKDVHGYQSVLINDEFPPWSLKTALLKSTHEDVKWMDFYSRQRMLFWSFAYGRIVKIWQVT